MNGRGESGINQLVFYGIKVSLHQDVSSRNVSQNNDINKILKKLDHTSPNMPFPITTHIQ